MYWTILRLCIVLLSVLHVDSGPVTNEQDVAVAWMRRVESVKHDCTQKGIVYHISDFVPTPSSEPEEEPTLAPPCGREPEQYAGPTEPYESHRPQNAASGVTEPSNFLDGSVQDD